MGRDSKNHTPTLDIEPYFFEFSSDLKGFNLRFTSVGASFHTRDKQKIDKNKISDIIEYDNHRDIYRTK